MVSRASKNNIIISAYDRTAAAFKSVRGSIDKTSAALTGLVGAAGFTLLSREAIRSAKETKIFSDQLKIGVGELSSWQFAAKSVNLESEKMADIFKDVSEKIGDAFLNQGGEAKDALDHLGLSAADLVKLNPAQQLLAIADNLGKVSSQSERVQIMESLASDASRLLPLLENDAEQLKALQKDAQNLGAVLTDRVVRSAEQADRAMIGLQAAGNSLGNEIIVFVGPALAELAGWLSEKLPRASLGWSRILKDIELQGIDLSISTLGIIQSYEKLRAAVLPSEEGQVGQIFKNLGFLETSEQAQKVSDDLEQVITTLKNKKIEIGTEIIEIAQQYKKLDEPFTVTPGDSMAMVGATATKSLKTVRDDYESLRTQLFTDEEKLGDKFRADSIVVAEAHAQRIISEQEMQEQLLALEKKYHEDKAALQKQSDELITSMRLGVAAQAAQLFGILAKDHKAFAVGQILLEKGIAIAQAKINTAVAVTKALSYDPTGGLAARVGTLGAIQIGLIAGTGVAQLAQLGKSESGGGASGGGIGSPGITTPAGSSFGPFPSQAPAPEQRIIIQLGDQTLADIVVKGTKEASQKDMMVFRTEKGYERVIVDS